MSSRHLSRIGALQALFTADTLGDLSPKGIVLAHRNNGAITAHKEADAQFTEKLLAGIAAKRTEIDAIIEKSAPEWPLLKIAIIDRNILRIGLFELLFGDGASVPPKVALNEAIELAKMFGGDSSGRFVNGVLGSVYRDLGSPRKDEKPKAREKEYFAGIVVCAKEGGEVYVALIKDPFDTWTLPKTHYRGGELSDAAALRAASEDLGLSDLTLKAPLSEHEYEAHEPGKSAVRRVAYFLALATKAALTVGSVSSAKEAAWFSARELPDVALYKDLRGIIESGIIAAGSSLP